MAGENLDLRIIIDTLLNAKGFQEAQAGLATLSKTTNESAKVTEGASGKQKGLARDLGGSRGAVADLTRVLLMNIGVTGATGNVAKAAGIGMSALSGAVGAASFGVVGLVAVAALAIPKLMEMGRSSKEAAEEARRLTDAAIEQLPELEALAEKIGKVNKAIELQVEAVRKQALDKQAETIAQYTRQIIELQQQASDLAIKIEKVGFGLERAAPGSATAKKVEEYKEQLRKLNLEIDRQSAVLQELLAAQEKSATAQGIRTQQTEDTAEAERRAEKAERERNKALADRLQLERDLQRESSSRQQQENKERADANKKQRDDLQKAAERLLMIERERGAHVATAKEAIRARKDQQAAEAAQIASSASYYLSFFTQNKAVRIAQAIADTYAAATRALAELGPIAGPAMAGVMVAAGLKNVAEIRKTEVGFDDPLNDLLAQRLGRKFAMDVLTHINAGFGHGMREASGGSVVNKTTINRGTTVNMGGVHGFIGSQTEFEKRLVRTITRAQRIEGRTTS